MHPRVVDSGWDNLCGGHAALVRRPVPPRSTLADPLEARTIENLRKVGVDALVPIGGENTLGVASRLSQAGVKLVGVPKTIDNDLGATDYCVGFDTAVNEVMRAIDRLHPTAEAQGRVMIVEVMGRDAGWIATLGGLAGGADIVLAPEFPFTIDEVCQRLRQRHEQGGREYSILVVGEGASPEDFKGQIVQDTDLDAFGHAKLGGIGHLLALEIERRTGYQTRVTVLGYTQRGGSPSAFDRILATRLGVRAVEEVAKGNFGVIVALQGTRIVPVRIQAAVAQVRRTDPELYAMTRLFA
ncbi:MAG: ATP-dependent 6-phosphofructokinase [Chloroflexi bacterium]|nr:ATP-dependent 6-phosphofructokinase [Chloroflexota bacterium]